MWASIFTFLLIFQYALSFVIPENNVSVRANVVDCEISPFETLPRPLLVRSNQFVYPTSATESTIKFSAGQTIDFACPGGRIVTDGTQTTLSLATATCVSGTRFIVNGNRFLWRQVTCSTNPVPTSRFTGNSCDGGRETEIGFTLTNTRFARVMSICFDEALQSTLYTYFDLIPAINRRITSTPRPGWIQGTGIYSISNVDSLYVRGTQRRTVNTLLGLSATSTKYIQNNNYFLSRGHLIARSDFFYAAQQNATFQFINALPQWQSFNGFNWDQVEHDVRLYAETHNVNLRVWTGGYGNTTLPHETTGRETELYLFVNGNNRGIPVPQLFWKVVYNPVTQRGVALIGVNNPYMSRSQIDQFCDDQSDRLTWLRWNKNDQSRGFSWACTVTAFRRIVRSMPNIEIRGLLF